MQNKTEKILGLCIILISLPPYWMTGIALYWDILFGARGIFILILLLLSNLAMTFFGIQVFRNRIKKNTWMFSAFGLIGLFPFYSYMVSGGIFDVLSEIKSPVVAKMFINRMKDGDDNVRSQSIRCLINVGEPAVDLLIIALKDKDENVRSGAAQALYGRNEGRIVDALINALNDKSEKVRTWIARELACIKNPKIIENPQTVKRLIAGMKDDSDSVRESVAMALPWLVGSPAWEPLIIALEDKSAKVRCAAVRSLAFIGGSRAIAPLTGALSDKSPEVRRAAVIALGNINDPDTVVPLIAALKNDTNRKQVIYELKRKNDPRATEALVGISNE